MFDTLRISSTAAQEESAKQLDEISDSDNTSDYFADVETSSCGSSDHGFGWTEIPENKVTPICPTGPLLSQGTLNVGGSLQLIVGWILFCLSLDDTRDGKTEKTNLEVTERDRD